MSIVEDLGNGEWLIKPTGEIRTCSRSTAYRIASKAQKELTEQEVESDESVSRFTPPFDDIEKEELPPSLLPSDEPLVPTQESDKEIPIEDESPIIWDLPTLDDIGGDEGIDPEEFQEENNRDKSFIDSFKDAEIKEDDEGNQKIHLGEFFIGDNPIISNILSSCDNALYGWAENKYEIQLWNESHRAIQRNLFVRTLGLVAPRTAIALDPMHAIYIMTIWMYGMPLFNIFNQIRKKKKEPRLLNPNPVEVVNNDA